jgi:hypothetical protein
MIATIVDDTHVRFTAEGNPVTVENWVPGYTPTADDRVLVLQEGTTLIVVAVAP